MVSSTNVEVDIYKWLFSVQMLELLLQNLFVAIVLESKFEKYFLDNTPKLVLSEKGLEKN